LTPLSLSKVVNENTSDNLTFSVCNNLLLIVRLLDAALKNEKPAWLPEHVSAISSNCNKKKLIAKRVSEKSDELFLTMFVNACGPLTVNAMVLQVSQKWILGRHMDFVYMY
jgi:hypothetical protein